MQATDRTPTSAPNAACRMRPVVDSCISATCRCPTSAPTPRSTWTSSPESPRWSAPTDRARPIWLRRWATWPLWAVTGSPPMPRWCAPVPRAREILGTLRTVLFAPEELAIVKGDPAERRRFLDELLVVRAPRYAGVRSDYDRVLK